MNKLFFLIIGGFIFLFMGEELQASRAEIQDVETFPQAQAAPAAASPFEQLPMDVIRYITCFLDRSDRISFVLTCKRHAGIRSQCIAQWVETDYNRFNARLSADQHLLFPIPFFELKHPQWLSHEFLPNEVQAEVLYWYLTAQTEKNEERKFKLLFSAASLGHKQAAVELGSMFQCSWEDSDGQEATTTFLGKIYRGHSPLQEMAARFSYNDLPLTVKTYDLRNLSQPHTDFGADMLKELGDKINTIGLEEEPPYDPHKLTQARELVERHLSTLGDGQHIHLHRKMTEDFFENDEAGGDLESLNMTRTLAYLTSIQNQLTPESFCMLEHFSYYLYPHFHPIAVEKWAEFPLNPQILQAASSGFRHSISRVEIDGNSGSMVPFQSDSHKPGYELCFQLRVCSILIGSRKSDFIPTPNQYYETDPQSFVEHPHYKIGAFLKFLVEFRKIHDDTH